MGVEIGAFKATNASYLLSGSYVVRRGVPYNGSWGTHEARQNNEASLDELGCSPTPTKYVGS